MRFFLLGAGLRNHRIWEYIMGLAWARDIDILTGSARAWSGYHNLHGRGLDGIRTWPFLRDHGIVPSSVKYLGKNPEDCPVPVYNSTLILWGRYCFMDNFANKKSCMTPWLIPSLFIGIIILGSFSVSLSDAMIDLMQCLMQWLMSTTVRQSDMFRRESAVLYTTHAAATVHLRLSSCLWGSTSLDELSISHKKWL